MRPLLVILFLGSYAIMTLLVVEQARTIESQRGLLHVLLTDSTQLAALKGKIAHEQSLAAQAAEAARDKATAESEQKMPDNNASAPAPKKNTSKRPHKHERPMKNVPGKPASDLEDVRRSTRVI